MDQEDADDGFHEPEVAHRLVYLVDENRWERTETLVAVGKKMFAWGEHQGCILVQDKTDGQINVAIAEMMAECFNQLNPPMKVHFMPCFLYILAQRPNQPTVRVEPLVFNHDKAKLFAIHAKLRAIHDATTLERETLSAFELFTYHGSKKAFVITNPCRIGNMWAEPEMHSVDRHEYSPIAAQIGLDNPSNLHAQLATKAIRRDLEACPPPSLNLDYIKRKLRENGSLLPESLPIMAHL
ncbi:hypothetical protein T484DRAFT_1770109 [Baffinella frigidus]|nr:hypothetical protein T484DRAFT_1770109 [Cryptophyta sp. CCMP2293]